MWSQCELLLKIIGLCFNFPLIILKWLVKVANCLIKVQFKLVVFTSSVFILTFLKQILKLFLLGQRVSEPCWAIYWFGLVWLHSAAHCLVIDGWVSVVAQPLFLINVYDLSYQRIPILIAVVNVMSNQKLALWRISTAGILHNSSFLL